MKNVIAAALIVSLLSPAAAEPSAERREVVEQYKISISIWQRWVAIAYGAALCNLRSDRYWEVFHTFDVLRSQRDRQVFEFTSAELDDIVAARKNVWRAIVQDLTCSDLVNGTDLDEVDAIERRLTGSYR